VRLVGGRHRGRPLAAPPGRDTRPTADRAREALFSILAHGYGVDLTETDVLDVFAGSGALGLEALSRGAQRVWFIESHRGAAEVIAANLRNLGEEQAGTVLRADATRPPSARQACALALLDPPYGSGLVGPALSALAAQGWLAEGALCVAEVAAKEEFPPLPGFVVQEERVYGAARFVFLRRTA
jgi:16S rRNA (guanine966-N2)-methyltransferase